MRKHVSSLLIFTVLILLPISLLTIDRFSSVQLALSANGEKLKEEGRQILEEVYRGTNNEMQIRMILERFHTRFSDILEKNSREKAKKIIEDLYNREMAPMLPSTR